jgi:tetratricopeptide (TPR) repeat protein
MIGISSNSAGVLLLPDQEIGKYSPVDLIDGNSLDADETLYLYAAVQDWEEIEGDDSASIWGTASHNYWLARAVSLIRLAIEGLEKSIEERVLEEVEDILSTHVSSEKVLDHLLIAPLKKPDSPQGLVSVALSHGFSAVASILNELVNQQPLIRKFSEIWLSIPEECFNGLGMSRQDIWIKVVEICSIKKLISASCQDFKSKWDNLMFDLPSPQLRLGINRLGQEFYRRLFPQSKDEVLSPEPLVENSDSLYDYPKRQVSNYELYMRVKKQINAIETAVSQGNDRNANKFLNELMRMQVSSGDENYAVKSLCNIAQKSADNFRLDFERKCLEFALQLRSTDSWTLIQYGDHLKRSGEYEKALEELAKAEMSKTDAENGEVATSSMADVYAQQGEYEKSIDIYKTIPNWDRKAAVRTAIADNYRKMGRIEDAEIAYKELIGLIQEGALEKSTGTEARVLAGMAEIAKRRGHFENAIETYRKILMRNDLDIREVFIYEIGLCNVLKSAGNLDDAYVLVDKIIQDYPFARQARFIRAAILGLLGRPLEGLDYLHEDSGSCSWEEWKQHYFRGLLLFKLKRYADAKPNLVENFSKTIAVGEEKSILRMASALFSLMENKMSEADSILLELPPLSDCQAQYLSLVLKLHVAALKKDLDAANALRGAISNICIVDTRLQQAVKALDEENYPLALECETDAFLALAA